MLTFWADKDKKPTETWNGNGVLTDAPDPHGVGFEGLVSKARESGKAVDAKEKKGDGESADVKVTLWANGFQVDGGELRDYNEPDNKEFMKDLNEGYVPKELQQKYNRKIGIALEDRRKDKMRLPTPPKYTAFSGAGASLGGASSAAPVIAKVNVSDSNKPIVDPSKPQTLVNLRLCNGQTIKLELNNDHTVKDLYMYVESVAPAAGSWNLVSGFPPKPLADMNLTLEQAKLLKSAITQKLG